MPLDQIPLSTSQLPAIVAGPILRRITRTTITVWAAFSIGDDVTLHAAPSGSPGLQESVTVSPTRIGSNLWLATFTLVPQQIDGGSFLSDKTYIYWLDSTGWPTSRRPTWHETDPAKAGFTYGTGVTLPTFLGLPDTLDDLLIAQTSCRKPHGGGRDGLRLIDDLVATSSGAGARPHLMFLTGDQIYADDVAGPLVPRIKRVAMDLIGIDEGSFFGGFPEIDGRQVPGESFGLTSGSAANHLWSFGEFLAMYLLAWSDVLWPAALPTWSEANSSNALDPASTRDEASWNKQRDALEEYRTSLQYIRRLLANVPSFMIFDDHEVTDDWNLTHGWCKKIYGNTKGTRIITNGLLAYVLCQHWGNKPEQFTQANSPEAQVLSGASWNSQGTSPDNQALRSALGIPSSIAQAPTSLRDLSTDTGIRYDYRLSSTDGFPLDVIVLDERSVREFMAEDGPPSRISRTGLDHMLPAPQAQATVPLLLIASAPILGLHLIEHYLQPAAALIPGEETTVDYESWTAFGPSFENVLEKMSSYARVVILSGDVHYGYVKRIEYEKPAGNIQLTGVQITASSARNADNLTMALHTLGELTQKLGIVRERSYDGFSQLTGNQISTLASPPPSGTVLPYDEIVDILLGRIFRSSASQPVIIPTDTALAYNLGSPDWRYKITHIDDEELPSGQDISAITTSAALSWSGWNPANSLQMLRGLQASDRNRIGRVFMGLPQIALIRFSMGSPATINSEYHLAFGLHAQGGGVQVTKVAVPF